MNDRTCIMTRKTASSAEMLRFVRDIEGKIIPDIKGNLPGRGAWIYAQRPLIEKAIKAKAFAHSFKKDVFVPEELADVTENLLKQSALKSLAMIRKSGALIYGATKVEKAFLKEKISLLIHAQEASLASIEKIMGAFYASRKDKKEAIPVLTLFDQNDLSVVFGDKPFMHMAVLQSKIAENFLVKVKKLQFYRGETIKNTASAVKESK